MKDIQVYRKELDEIDRQLVSLFEQRMQVAAEVAEFKRQTGKKVFDREREEEKLKTVASLVKNNAFSEDVAELFSEIMFLSRRYQHRLLNDGESEKAPVREYIEKERE